MSKVIAKRFEELAQEWKEETIYFSSLQKIVFHPAYQEIIAMGDEVIPLIIDSLRNDIDHWFWALTQIVGEDMAAGSDSMQAAALRWIDWHDSNIID